MDGSEEKLGKEMEQSCLPIALTSETLHRAQTRVWIVPFTNCATLEESPIVSKPQLLIC